ncbi:YciI family protein [Microbacterium sp. A82]|uniref:YciI family protein n=1 Tax=Microbacterium sp. A82 TaxID=3450452 RepID=UPI003F3C1665
MKFMLIMRATDAAVEAYKDVPFEQVIEAMGKYNESMMKAGVLLAGEGLTDAAEGFVVDFSAETPLVTDGPYGETKELFNGFWIIEVSTREEAAQWAGRAPLGPGSFLEVRRVTGVEDFPADNEWIEKEEIMRGEQAKRAQES